MLEFTRVSRWFRVADGYTLRYNSSGQSWRVCAPGGTVVGTVGSVTEAERLANQHAEDRAAADAAVAPVEDDEPEPPFDPVAHPVEVRGYSNADIDAAAAEQGIGVGAAMLSLAMGASYEELSRRPKDRYLTDGHGSAIMVTETNGDTGEVTMKPCQCLIPTGKTEDGSIVAAPCGSQVPDKRDFKPGHDAKLKSTLIKAHREGGTVIVREGGARTEASAMELAKARGWERFLTAAKPRKAAKPKADGKDNTGVDHADDQPDAEEPVGASQPARVKVRSAWKDGFITKIEPGVDDAEPDQITVTYTNGKGKPVELVLPRNSNRLQIG